MSTNAKYGVFGQGHVYGMLTGYPVQSSNTNLSLNSAYSAFTSGSCYCGYLTPPSNTTLSELWIMVNSVNGDWAGSTDGVVNFEIREGTQANYKPVSGTPYASGTIAIGATDSHIWRGVTGLSISLTGHYCYVVCIGDADGSASDYAQLRVSNRIGASSAIVEGAATSTNGFSTVSNNGYPIALMAKLDDTWVAGSVWDTITTKSSNQYEVGVYFQLPDDVVLAGMYIFDWSNIYVSTPGLEINLYAEGTPPGGTPLKQWLPPARTAHAGPSTSIIFKDSEIYQLYGGTSYRFVIKMPINSTTPRQLTTASNVPPNALKYLSSGLSRENTFYMHTIEDGAGNWIDTEDMIPSMSLILLPSSVLTQVSTF